MLLFGASGGPVNERAASAPVYLKPETWFSIALVAGLAYVVVVALSKVLQHR
jgi:hypothetical protein